MDNRKKGIVISLILSLVFTGVIIFSSNSKYAAATKTTEVVTTSKFIPVGQVIKDGDITTKKVPESIAKNLVTDKKEVVGKTAMVSLVKGQYIYKNSLDAGKAKRDGFVTVFVPTDISNSACVVAGEIVDIYVVSQDNEGGVAQNIYKGAKVLRSLDQSGHEIDAARRTEMSEMTTPGSKVPVTVGLEVPEEVTPTLVQAGKNNSVYLVKSDIKVKN